MAKRVTTLFIEDTAIRLLVARGKHAEKWASVPLEPGMVKHGQIQDKVRIVDKLKETFRWAKVSNRVVLGLSEPGSLYRIITLPKLPDSILPEAVKREAERVIPLPQDEIYLAYQVISVHQDDMQLFLAAFSRNAVDTLIGAIQAAGIKAVSLDLVPLALCRAIDKSTAIVVSLRSSNFEIAIMSDNIPQVIRSLSLPGEEESLVDKLPTIAEELERTVTFYNSSHAEKPLDNTIPLFVDGELVHAPETWQSLVGNLGFIVTPLPSALQTERDFDVSQFTVNVGLALKDNPRDSLGSIINVNALPKAFQPEKPKISRVIIPIGAGVAVLILVLVWAQANSVKSNASILSTQAFAIKNMATQKSGETASIQAQITKEQSNVKPLQDQMISIGKNAVALDTYLSTMNSSRNKINTELNSMLSLAPSEMNVVTISISSNITVSGSAVDPALIYSYARDLKATKIFTDVQIQAINSTDPNYAFSIAITRK
jgi:type IV pilus assembly protein PilM